MIVAAVSAPAVGWQAPGFALGLPAPLPVGAAWGHLRPTIQAKRPNPGFFTAMLLYIPLRDLGVRRRGRRSRSDSAGRRRQAPRSAPDCWRQRC